MADAGGNPAGYSLTISGSSYSIAELNSALIPLSPAIETFAIDPDITCSGAQFKFGPLGNLLAGSDSQTSIGSDGQTFTIYVYSAMGSVECVRN